MRSPPVIERPPEVYNYLDKFTLHKGDRVIIKSRSYYLDSEGNKVKTGVTGTYRFSCVVKEGIMVVSADSSAGIYVFLGKDRKVEGTGTYLRAHILSLPAEPRKKIKRAKKKVVKQ
jgi:hypothetical protein